MEMKHRINVKAYLSAVLDLADKSIVSFVAESSNNHTLVFETFDIARSSNLFLSCTCLFSSDKKFYVTDTCVPCGNCEKICPFHNIKFTDKKPIWNRNCTHCMACIGSCPTEAIEYGKHTKGLRRYYLR